MAEKLLSEISAKLRTEEIGNGKIFVYDLSEVVKIRPGETGDSAL